MEPATARIPAHSRRQAMDWSLVLISQGIETTIERPDKEAGWRLLVAAQDYDSAVNAIRQYRLENRGWPWQHQVLRPGVVFDWGSLAWVCLAGVFFWLSLHTDLHTPGLMDSAAVGRGQWWRLFTAVWLHADVAHLAANATLGFVLIGLAMGRYGTGAGLLAAYLAGAGGNVAAWLLAAGGHRSLGASGMVMGALGLVAAPWLGSLRTKVRAPPKYVVSGIGGGVLLFVLLGVAPDSDVLAHFGGFISGLLLGALLTRVPDLAQRLKINLLSGLLFALLVILPWWLALHRTGFTAVASPGP